MANQIVGGKTLSNDTFSPFQSSGGLVRSCNDYYSLVQKGGETKLEKDNMGVTYETAFGGAKKKRSVKKGTKKSSTKKRVVKRSGKKGAKKSSTVKRSAKKGAKKRVMKKSGKKTMLNKLKNMFKQKGGQESSGATYMDMRFFNPNANLVSASANSGKGASSAYGSIDPLDVGVGMLAPYTTSSSSTANHASNQQTGGKKAKKSVKKSGKKSSKKSVKKSVKKSGKKSSKKSVKKSVKKSGKKSSKKSVKKGRKATKSYNPKFLLDFFSSKPAKKSTKSKKRRAQRGGSEVSGYDPLDKFADYNSQKGGKDLIPKLSSKPIDTTRKLFDKGIDGAVDVLDDFVDAYDQSIKKMENISIGNQRLITGGKKSKKSVKKSAKKTSSKKSVKKSAKKSSSKKSVKKSAKKSSSKKSVKKSGKKSSSKKVVKKSMKKRALKGGGTGSDFALTLSSRGPANAPDNYWGVPGEMWFRQFNKTGDYIPNSRLAEAATPQLVSGKNDGIVMGYDDMTLSSYGKP